MSWQLILYYISFVGCSIYALISLLRFGAHYNSVFGLYLIMVTGIELSVLIGQWTETMTEKTTTIAYKIVFLLTSSFLATLYLIRMRKAHRIAVIVCMLLTAGILLLYGEIFSSLFSTTYGVANSLFIIFICITWYLHKLSSVDDTMIYDDPFFWYTTGMFIWASIFLLRILPAQFLYVRDQHFWDLLRSINLIVNIVTNTLFIIGMYKADKKKLNYGN